MAGDHEVTFRLKHPQPSFPALLAAGFSPVYPCHVSAGQMRQKQPVGTGPYRFGEFRRNELIRVVRNPTLLEAGPPIPGRHRLRDHQEPIDGFAGVRCRQGRYDLPSNFQPPILRDTQRRRNAVCPLVPSNVQRNVIINRSAPPFDNPEMRRAVALTLDRRAFIDTLTQGEADIGGALLAPPGGVWGMPAEMMSQCRAMIPTSRKGAPRPAPSCNVWALAPPTGSGSRFPRGTPRRSGILPCC